MRAKDWVKGLLKRHGLEKPDGRPLYQYRVTNSEFESLTEFLKLTARLGVTNVSRMLFWDAIFVIYASEWWRRHYTGSWGWDGIFNSIDIDYNQLSINRRNDLIETGLLRWHREVRTNNGARQLLGTIATEGGLPLHQLSESGGWLARILNPVIKKHLSKGLSISILIDGYHDTIPSSYRSEGMTEILSDIVKTVTQLRQEYKLEEKEAPIKWLDSNLPEWRAKFPLPIDNETARSLLSELIDTASKEKNEQPQNPFEIERYIIKVETDSPEIIAQLDLPTFIFLESIGLNKSKENIPANFIVEVVEPNGTSWPWCRGISTTFQGKQALKLFGRRFKVSGNDAIKELGLQFKVMGDIFFELPLINGCALDTKLPWLFRNLDNKWLLHGVATQAVKDQEALVYMPSRYSCECICDNSVFFKINQIHSGNIFKLSGSISIFDEDSKFKVSAGVEESVLQYRLTGRRYANHSIPSEIYVGKPTLIEMNLATGYPCTRLNNRLLAKLVGVNTNWQSLSQVKQGYYEVRLLDDDGNIQLQKRVGILNKNFSFKINPDSNHVTNGSIVLESINNCPLSVGDKNISHQIKNTPEATKIKLQANEQPPQYVNISLHPQQQGRELILSFPFPSSGALLFDADGVLTPFSKPLYLGGLRGYRLKVFDNSFISDKKINLDLSLMDSEINQPSLKDIHVQVSVHLTGQVTEFSINDWVQPIEALFGVSSSPDSEVKISMSLLGREQFRINIRQFGSMILPDYENGFVELSPAAFKQVASDKLETIKVHALFLNQPSQSDFVLSSQTSEGITTGKWFFYPEKCNPGPWIIYPPIGSSFNFRPILWNVGTLSTEISIANTLPKAIVIQDAELRESAIRRVLKKMASDLNHKSWNYLNNLWEKTYHLPTPTFDIWKIAISEPSFIASLLLHNHEDIVEKLENELPLLWELVPLDDWKKALLLWKNKFSESLGEEQDLITKLLQKKIEKIELLTSSMGGIGKILRLELLGQNSPELQAIDKILRPQIENELQGLLRRKADTDWPILLSSQITSYYQELNHGYRMLLQTPHQFQQAIIFLPAILAWDMLSEDGFLRSSPSAVAIFKIKQLKSFDEDWFNTIFQYLSVWLYQHNKEKE